MLDEHGFHVLVNKLAAFVGKKKDDCIRYKMKYNSKPGDCGICLGFSPSGFSMYLVYKLDLCSVQAASFSMGQSLEVCPPHCCQFRALCQPETPKSLEVREKLTL